MNDIVRLFEYNFRRNDNILILGGSINARKSLLSPSNVVTEEAFKKHVKLRKILYKMAISDFLYGCMFCCGVVTEWTMF